MSCWLVVDLVDDRLLIFPMIPWRCERRLARDAGGWRCCGLVARYDDAGFDVALVNGCDDV